jgi:hypothetical protein
VQPNKSHKLEVKNLVDPAANGIYTWKDASTTAYLSPGKEKAVEVRLQQQYLKGFLDVTCDVRAYIEGESVGCQVAIDGVPQEGTLVPDTTGNYVLDPGSHTVTVTLTGDMATLWAPASQEKAVTVSAGKTAVYKPRFDKAGHLIVNLDQEGVVGDFYLNGELVATQVPGFDAWVEPNKSQKVEVTNLTDPAAVNYRWLDATKTTTVGSSQERTLTLTLKKEEIAGPEGTLSVWCWVIVESSNPFWCEVYMDGEHLGNVGPNVIQVFSVPAGDHQIVVYDGPNHVWINDPFIYNVSIPEGEMEFITSLFYGTEADY